MICFPNPDDRPFKHVPAPMRQRSLNTVIDDLREQGMVLSFFNDDDSMIHLNLRGLAVATGGLERGRVALYDTLSVLHIVRVDVEPQDIAYLLGANAISHGLSRALQSRIEPFASLLTSIEVDELFTNLERATAALFEDRHPDEAVQQRLNAAARHDLPAHGLLGDSSENYRAAIDNVPEHVPPPLPREFQQEVAPWRSPFDTDGGYQ